MDIAKPVQEALSYWDKFREIWEKSKAEVIDHYRSIKMSAVAISNDISRWVTIF